jgi:hypothetical protein
VDHQVYNATDCREPYAKLPVCLEKIQMALEVPTRENRHTAHDFYFNSLWADSHGILLEAFEKQYVAAAPSPIGNI